MSAKPSASMRAKVSDTPPGLVGEMIRTDFVGQSAADAICERPTAATRTARMRGRMSNPMNEPHEPAHACDMGHESRTLISAQLSYALSTARSISKLPELARRQGKRPRLGPEWGQGMSHRIRKRAAGGDDAAFARALCTQRIVRRRIVFRDHAAQVWKVRRSRQQIIG